MKLLNTLQKNSPMIFTVLGLAGIGTTIVLSCKGTLHAQKILEEKQPETKKEVVKDCWKCYLPTGISAGLTATSFIMAYKAHGKQLAAAVGALAISQESLKLYQEKVIERLGDKRHREVKDAVAEEKMKEHPLGNKEIIITGGGDSLVFDAYSGRYFMSSMDKMQKIENELNRRLLQEMWISLNEVYFELGLDQIKAGNDMGWNVDYGIDMDFSTQLADDGRPCIVLDYVVGPTTELKRW